MDAFSFSPLIHKRNIYTDGRKVYLFTYVHSAAISLRNRQIVRTHLYIYMHVSLLYLGYPYTINDRCRVYLITCKVEYI